MHLKTILCLMVLALAADGASAQAADNETQVVVHFFYTKSCPHCAHEKPFLQDLEERHPWLKVEYLEVSNPLNAYRYYEMAQECGGSATGVPATFVCGDMKVGYDKDETTGKEIEAMIHECYFMLTNKTDECKDVDERETSINLPLLGEVEASKMSLPLFTLVIGGLDGFNPCAFFVLFFLLSLLIHAKSRARMLLIGGIFVFFSGFIYFIFMAAWLNLFLMLDELKYITFLAGVIALAVAILNIKDFFYFKKGLSLSIPESAKPKLFSRMRELVKATALPSMILGTVILAIAANTYELLCTAGFPMVYTRVLTLSNLSTTGYYMYLALYNIVYVIPLFTIVLTFTFTLGSRKLKEEEGQILKLLSGLMMLCLGLMLVAAPELLNNILAAFGVLAFSVGATAAFILATRMRKGR